MRISNKCVGTYKYSGEVYDTKIKRKGKNSKGCENYGKLGNNMEVRQIIV